MSNPQPYRLNILRSNHKTHDPECNTCFLIDEIDRLQQALTAAEQRAEQLEAECLEKQLYIEELVVAHRARLEQALSRVETLTRALERVSYEHRWYGMECKCCSAFAALGSLVKHTPECALSEVTRIEPSPIKDRENG